MSTTKDGGRADSRQGKRYKVERRDGSWGVKDTEEPGGWVGDGLTRALARSMASRLNTAKKEAQVHA